MMAVAVTMDPTFSAGKPRLLFEGRYDMGPVPGMTNYDVSRDGERFLMLRGQTGSTPSHFDIVLDWFGDVPRQTPAGPRN